MKTSLRACVRVDVDDGTARLEVNGDLTTSNCAELTSLIDRAARTFDSRMVIDLSAADLTEDGALDMLSSHIALLPDQVRILRAASP